MPIDFPSGPTVGQQYSYLGKTWEYNGAGWALRDAGTSYIITTTAVDRTLSNRERCTVTASGRTITLPVSPLVGWEVSVIIAGNFIDTVIARNSTNIMSLAEDMIVDRANASITLFYVDSTQGWRLI